MFGRKKTEDPAAVPKRAHLALGRAGEDAALTFLEGRGFRLFARNWRPRGRSSGLELDLVGECGKLLVFVEVKTRRGESPLRAAREKDFAPAVSDPLAAFTPAKQEKMVRAARHYLEENGLWERPCRFDLVCVTIFPGEKFRAEHHADVIELAEPVGGGNASWQPW